MVLIHKLKGESLHDSFTVSSMNCFQVLDQGCTKLRNFKKPVVTEAVVKCKSIWIQWRLISFKVFNSDIISFITLLQKGIKGTKVLRDDIQILPLCLHNSTVFVTAAEVKVCAEACLATSAQKLTPKFYISENMRIVMWQD